MISAVTARQDQLDRDMATLMDSFYEPPYDPYPMYKQRTLDMVEARIPEIKRSAEARRRFLAEEDYRAACDERAKLKREERSALHQQAVENHINNEEYLASSSSSSSEDEDPVA